MYFPQNRMTYGQHFWQAKRTWIPYKGFSKSHIIQPVLYDHPYHGPMLILRNVHSPQRACHLMTLGVQAVKLLGAGG